MTTCPHCGRVITTETHTCAAPADPDLAAAYADSARQALREARRRRQHKNSGEEQ